MRERGRLLNYGMRFLLGRIIRFSGANAALRLRRRANLARDAHHYELAAELYEEALLFLPGDQGTHVQAAHMYKEAGDLSRAEQHYREAQRVGPRSASLALQLGHFFKVAGRPDEAAAAYAEALALHPGWPAAAEELARADGATGDTDASIENADPDAVVGELLKRSRDHGTRHRETLQVRRLGARRIRSRWGMLKALRGIEAVHGFCITAADASALHISVDGALFHVEPLRAGSSDDDEVQRRKYVFNAWCDFSAHPPGKVSVELAIVDSRGRKLRTHRETLLIAAPLPESAHPGSDGLVAVDGDGGSLEERINRRPSMIRPADRHLIEGPVGTVLVQRADQLGDMVCSLPAIRRLRTLFPDSRLVGLVTAANLALAASFGLFDDIVVAEFDVDPVERRRVMSLERQEHLRRKLASYRIDIAIDLGEGAESRPLLLLSGAPVLIGFKDRDFPWLTAGFDFNGHDPINRVEMMPPSRKLLALVESLAAMLSPAATVQRDPSLDRSRLATIGLAPDQRYIVLHAGARLAYSRWPFYQELAAMLIERTALSLFLFADDESLIERMAAALPPERLIVVRRMLPFADFDALLSFATAFVGNDSGPKHLAALRGVPVVSLHMARLNWSEWGQEMTGVVISRRVPCAGCGISDYGEDCGKDFACLRHIHPEEVFGALIPYLRE